MQGGALRDWYVERGRHELPWRQTRDPWAILVSEVMLQQTSVARVLRRWGPFLDRWPDPATLARTPVDELLRAWAGLGYPRRAIALHRSALVLSERGWPGSEAGLRDLPGIGPYTARALRVLAFDDRRLPAPRDVNTARVAARHRLGVEPHQAAASRLDEVLARRPRGLTGRDHALALFDVGALHCRARPRCDGCPLASSCASRDRLRHGDPARPRRQAPWQGSQRQLRGAVLRELLGPDPPSSADALRRRVSSAPAAAGPGAVECALAGLRQDGLIAASPLTGEPATAGP